MRGGRSLFRDLRVTVPSGGALVLSGPNGAGKTSLLRIMAGLLMPTGGTVRLDGGGRQEVDLREQSHFIGIADALKSSLTAQEHLAFWRALLGAGSAYPLRDALVSVGLGHLSDTPAGYFSSGQRRRLALARLLVTARPVWLLDEPTNALDGSGRERLMAMIAQHRERGGIAVVATHEPLELPGAEFLPLAGAVTAVTA